MELKLHSEQHIRTSTDQSNNFIDVFSMKHETGLLVQLHPFIHYIEIREDLRGFVRMFLFKTKGEKKNYNFGKWEDAKVVYSKNEVIK
ncbi:MAG: hypothetical protein GY870_03325 [archaeon]|nr:hypothetical protein [archaeon]